MIEQVLHSLGSLLPAGISRRLSPETCADEEAGEEGCSDLLSASQQRFTTVDGRRDVCRACVSLPYKAGSGAACFDVGADSDLTRQVVLSIETFSALQSKV